MRLRALVVSAPVIILLLAAAACSKRSTTPSTSTASAPSSKTRRRGSTRAALGKRLWKIEQEFYASREYLPAWVDGDETTAQWKDLVQQLKYSERHGLDPASYGVAEFEQLREASQTQDARHAVSRSSAFPSIDARMTYAYLRYAADLLGWTHSPKRRARQLADGAEEGRPGGAADRGRDQTTGPRRRSRSWRRRTRSTRGCRRRSSAELAAPTGRAEQIRMNLERWRWAPRDLGERYILVNVPAYQMQVMEGERPVLAMRVIVGDTEQPDAAVQRRDDLRRVQPVLEHSARHPARRDAAARGRAIRTTCDRNNIEVVGTSGSDAVDPSIDRLVGRGGDARPALPADAGRRERARSGEVHLPESLQRLPARHAGRHAVQQGARARSATAASASRTRSRWPNT